MLTVAPPPTETLLYEVEEDTGGDGFCHILDDDGRWLCRGQKPGPREGRSFTHRTRHPARPTCDGCGAPRCPKCRAEYIARNGGGD
jgi:hypothetical protein